IDFCSSTNVIPAKVDVKELLYKP
ncbi:MAG: hypothetical protein JWO64_2267, partial [Hyphomicrobiales bacterium]|nr:hypothetical protein [Hyphomicrobiales bacterium]